MHAWSLTEDRVPEPPPVTTAILLESGKSPTTMIADFDDNSS